MRLLTLLLFLGLSVSTWAQQKPELDTSRSLFCILAALNATGYDADIASPNNSPLRKTVRDHFAKKMIPSIGDLRDFVARHRRSDPAEELSQYVSFAMSVKEPPEFESKFEPEEPLPPDVAALEGLGGLMRRFYEEADLDKLWTQSQPLYEAELARYQLPLIQVVRDVDGYLRNVNISRMQRRFVVYVDLLGAPGQLHVRAYKKDVAVVVTPTPEVRADEIREAYLNYLLDPLTFKYRDPIKRLRGLAAYAQDAPLLDGAVKDDPGLLTVQSLAKAIESRIARPKSQGPAIVDQAMKEGFVLTAAFADLLPGYEKQEVAMSLYFPDLVAAIELKKEAKRIEGVNFATARRERTIKVTREVEVKPDLTAVEQLLDQGEASLRANQLAEARQSFDLVLQRADEKSSHARAYYGIARIAFFERQDPDTVEALFNKVLALAPDASTQAWALVHLGLVTKALSEQDRAAKYFRSALTVQGAAPAALKRAQDELNKLGLKP